MDSDFPEFDKSYLKLMLPENPDQFHILAARANFGIYRHDLWHSTGRRFAESIVAECIRLCDEVDLAGADDCIDKIQDHFGVVRQGKL